MELHAALADLDKAVQLDPRLAMAYALRGVVSLELNRTGTAMDDANAALRLDPRIGPAHYVRGLVFFGQEQFDKALTDLDAAIEYEPKEHGAYVFRGLIRMSRKQFDAALADFNTAIELNPRNALAYHDRGWLRVLTREFALAIPDLDNAIALRRNYASAYFYRAAAYAGLGKVAEAEADIAQVRRLDPKLIAGRGDPTQVVATSGTSPGQPANLGSCGNEPDATRRVEACSRVLSAGGLSPRDQASAHLMRALGYLNKQGHGAADARLALADSEAAIRLAPADAYAYRTRAIAHDSLGEWPLASADFDKAIQLEPNEGYHYLLRGMARLAHGDVTGAKRDLEKAKALDPGGAGVQAEALSVALKIIGGTTR
jgi:tetratricopeptide (TPR) repeat protein